ncbi:hypothetical protein [Marinithermus hydrothermalis]|uniref:Uncharacterized protein n=1 Tax=Marinithermus hydrothermalis (strain DSM 14884 / JCM 11576 / T1) TaxID=869210 RepID=F2NNK6_MARHT|nr:hypothetical protein [Marinithermus hydrothermalis]AEB11021.1 hypothetical protein Marky_0260 [Marinithermus hydrothermalis DSM 14884]
MARDPGSLKNLVENEVERRLPLVMEGQRAGIVLKLDLWTRLALWLLLLAVIANLALPFFSTVRPSESLVPQRLDLRRGSAIAISTSGDGRVVYLSDGIRVYRSTEYGNSGTWELLVEAEQ